MNSGGMFSVRNQLSILATTLAAIVISAIPVTISFAESMYGSPYSQQYGSMYQPQQQYLYWCTGQSGGYYSYSPCPQYQQPQYPQPSYPQSYGPKYQYYQPQYSPYYPQYFYQPMYYGYTHGSYSYSYNYNYSSNWGYWY